jgi:REP element-mobilizing transposase RayT
MSSTLPSRHSIRLKGYDYAQAGLYFITICVQDRLFLFGEVHDGAMQLNDAGRMVEQWYAELENKYPDKRCHEMVVMPNHFHCIIENISVVRATPCGCPPTDAHDVLQTDAHVPPSDAHVGAPLRGRPRTGATIPDAVDWFKTMTTNAYIRGVRDNGWPRFNRKLWQRNYYENIIRTPDAYENISNYIVNNPEKWKDDMFHL